MNPLSNERAISQSEGMNGIAGREVAVKASGDTKFEAAIKVGGSQDTKVGVSLPVPLAVANTHPTAQHKQEIDKLLKTVTAQNLQLTKLSSSNLLNLKSPAAFEIELGKLITELGKEQQKLKITDIQRAAEQNKKKIDENQTKMKEAADAAKEAKKAGILGKIFGWLTSIASIIIGSILVATGVGAAAGALMIAAGVVGIVSQAIQQAAEAGLISKDVMDILGPVMMAIEIGLAVVSMVVSFGAAAVKLVTNAAAKVAELAAKATKVAAETVAKTAVKVGAETVAQVAAKVGGEASAKIAAQVAAKTASEAAAQASKIATNATAKGIKLATQITDAVLDVGNGASKTASSVLNAKSSFAQAELLENRSALTLIEQLTAKLIEQLNQAIESNQKTMEVIFQIINDRDLTLNKLARNPVSV